MASNPLKTYQEKRDFSVTPEPAAGGVAHPAARSFVIQKHWATQLHYDFRLELDGTMKSWAIPKGPSLDSKDRRLAVHVEDHPISYNSFEGRIPENQYGAGEVIIWDKGTWIPDGDPHQGYRDGHLQFTLHGHKLHGKWILIRMKGKDEKKEPWLLIKEKDQYVRPAAEFSIVDAMPDSVADLDCEDVPARPNMTANVSDDVDHPGRTSAAANTPAAMASSPQSNAGARPVLYNKVHVSHPDRVVDADTGLKKIDLIRYYSLVAPFMMPHLKDRPVSLVRAPLGIDGELFFQKHLDAPMQGIALLDRSLDPEHAALIEIVDPMGLLSAAQINVIEFHTWNSLKTAINTPERMTFDLDPGAGVAWEMTQEATLLMCSLLEQLGLPPFVKTSGGKGMHIVVPLQPLHDWKTVRDISHAIVLHAAAIYPMHFVAKSGAQNRIGKIYIDYLRNGFGATTVAAWSVRARPGLAVSVPVTRNEIAQLHGSAHWTIATIQTRLEQGNTPWNGYSKSAQNLAPVMQLLAPQKGTK